MGYCTLEQLKEYKAISTDADDNLLEDLIERATARIDKFCHRTFAAAAGTHLFDADQDVEGRFLYLDDDFITVDAVINGDGTVIAATSYVLLPNNTIPKYAIKLKSSSSISWNYVNDPEQAISISGSIGYSAAPPADIVHAAVRTARWLYDQRDAPFETVGMPELGTVTVPTGLPVDIKDLLEDGGYVRPPNTKDRK